MCSLSLFFVSLSVCWMVLQLCCYVSFAFAFCQVLVYCGRVGDHGQAIARQYFTDLLFLFQGGFMARRFKMSRGKSRRSFTKGAQRVHRKNFGGNPMRGGIRL